MHIQKRVNGVEARNGFHQESSPPKEQKERKHKCWRRFMNARATDRAYVPTPYGMIPCTLHKFIQIFMYFS